MLGSLASNDLLLLAGVPFAAIIIGVLFGVVLPRRRRRRQRYKGITLAAFEAGVSAPPRPTRNLPEPDDPKQRSTPRHTRVQAEASYAPPAREATGTLGAAWTPPGPPPPVEAPRLRLETATERTTPSVLERPPTPLDRLTPIPDSPPPLKVHKPVDGTLQFLPGRLEVVEGRELGQEIRFVRQQGPGPTEITFGRQDGNPYKHIQLHEPTVSRTHARMTYEEDNRWRLTNLSRTNPISVNAASMAPENTSVLLKDGDRIEMGEVVFRFKAK